MKIAYAGDWHANTNWSVRAIEHAAANQADIILHLGDYGYDFHPGFIQQVEEALVAADIELWFIDGNHEDFNWLYQQPLEDFGRRKISDHVFHLPRGYRWTWNGVRFLAMGGAFSVDRRMRKLNKSWWQEETISLREARLAIDGGPADVMISHDCPSGVEIPGLGSTSWMWPREAIAKSNEHQDLLRTVVDEVRPRQIWHGHYHRRYDAMANFGYGPVEVHGLDMDATALSDNVVLVDLPEWQSLSTPVDVEAGLPGADG